MSALPLPSKTLIYLHVVDRRYVLLRVSPTGVKIVETGSSPIDDCPLYLTCVWGLLQAVGKTDGANIILYTTSKLLLTYFESWSCGGRSSLPQHSLAQTAGRLVASTKLQLRELSGYDKSAYMPELTAALQASVLPAQAS
jgi:hypothetical protein